MELKFVFRKQIYSLAIGYKTPWFSQLAFISLTRLYYENHEVVHATHIWSSR